MLAGDRLREKDLMPYVDKDLGNGNHHDCMVKSPRWDFCGRGSYGKSGRLNNQTFALSFLPSSLLLSLQGYVSTAFCVELGAMKRLGETG